MNRTESLMDIAKTVRNMIRTHGRRDDIIVTFGCLKHEDLNRYTPFQRDYFRLREGEEYFFLRDPDDLLYAVNVTGDSLLAAAGELLELASRKF